jgi:gluconokinase
VNSAAGVPDDISARAAPIIIVMGVSGCGKSTVARALAAAHGFAFIEADDHHPEENRRHMAAGRALTDAMREPFVASLSVAIQAEAGPCAVAFSALRRAHRARIRALGRPTLFLHLIVDAEAIAARMRRRDNHFMPVDLLASQFAALEPAQDEPDLQSLVAEGDAANVHARASACVHAFLQRLAPAGAPDSPAATPFLSI